MTATHTTALASESWAMIVRDENPMPALIARDWLMEGANCERDAAVKLLAIAAADWLQGLRVTLLRSGPLPNDNTVSGDTVMAIGDLDLKHASRCRERLAALPKKDAEGIFDRWVWHAEFAIAILRELLA